jgi:glyoxylase-like metal-dependent hydrolase (beta-lactamase superfamily II)
MVNPLALYMGAQAVYGAEEMQRSYGTLQPVDAARVRITDDGQVVELAGRPLLFAHTPGHARHHHCIWDEASRGWFTGDTFGLSYREHDTARGAWILPTSTPVQFEPEALKQSMERMLQRQPACMHLTHYDRVHDVPRLAGLLFEQLDAMVAAGLRLRDAPDRHEALKGALSDIYRAQLLRHGVADADAAVALLDLDIELNPQGLAVWLDRGAKG